MTRGKGNEKPVPPAEIHLIPRVCDLPRCDRTYSAHAEVPLTWCSAAHRKEDPRGGVG